MSNLSELLPAGAGAKSADFVASGTLGSGVTVVLKADGTVEAVAAVAQGVGSPVVFEAGITIDVSSAYDSTNNKIVIGYRDDGAGGYGTAVVGTVSGTSISFGTPVPYISAATDFTSVVFDSSTGKVVVFYRDSGTLGKAKVGTVSGTSISFGAEATFNNANTQYIGSTYDSTNNKPVVVYRDGGNSGFGTACVGTVSGTSISFGAEAVFSTANVSQQIRATFDSTNGKVVVAYRDDGNSNYGTAIVGTVSGTSISFGSSVVFESAATSYIATSFDSTNNKVVIVYRDGGNADSGTAVVGTVSGTSISFGTAVSWTGDSSYYSATYDASAGKIVISYRDDLNVGKYGTVVSATVSGTSISFDTPLVFEAASVTYTSAVFDSNANKVAIAYRDVGNSNYGTSVVFTTGSTNNTDFIGITDQAIADTATGAVIVQGGVSTSAVAPYVFSVGSDSVFEAESINRVSSVYDSGNQKVVVTYTDTGNSNYGTAVVGTVSGTSISFGTPVVFEAATTYDKAAVYDPDTGKIVIAYRDFSNSNYGTAIVGTVSGTSISFGTAVVYNSALTIVANNGSGAVYDTTNDKVVIAYKDGGNSNYGTGIVGTVSGTSISFGSETVFNTGNTIDPSVAFDSDNSKIIISYRDSGNSSYGTAVVGTVSGTSISFGSGVVFNSATTIGMRTIYDTNAGKVLIPYSDSGNSTYGTAVVGTVSGTSISFGTPSVYAEYYTSAQFAVFDSAANQTVICTGGTTGTLNAFAASISGTSVSFSSGTLVSGSTSTYGNLAYDSTNSKIIISYTDSTNSSYGTSNILSLSPAFTIGTDYYVQADGTLSTTVSSVPAGRALSSTSILLEG